MTVYLLGLDGASINTIQETLARIHLPNFEKVIGKGTAADLKSVYPYVTAPAWTTIFSGVNPGKHGIFEMFELKREKVVPSNMRGSDVPMLWDYLSWANKRTLAVGVPFIYPAPKINGLFVTGRFAPKLSCYPENASAKFDLQGFDYDDLTMQEKTEKIMMEGSEKLSSRILENLGMRTRTISRMIDSEKWDVAIIVEGLPDDVLHLSYGDNAIVDEMYLGLDRMLGEILQRMSSDDSLIIFSDHGFCKVENVLFMSEWLVKKKYAALNESATSRLLLWLGLDWESLSSQGLTSRIFRFMLAHFPWLADRVTNSLKSGMVVDKKFQLETSKVSAFSINEPLAWLRISKDHGEQLSQDLLVSELEGLKKQGLLKNIFEVDKIYSGKYVRFAPGSILVEAPEGWAVDTLRWNRRNLTGKPLFTKRGVHRREGLLVFYGKDKLKAYSPRIHDIVPTVLEMMKLPCSRDIDGKSLLERTKRSEEPVTELLNVAKRL
jgi:predicted AlkP superfamily phosphohydrolase/phosphomutase